VRQVEWISRERATAWTIAALKDCNCFGRAPVSGWGPPSPESPPALSGDSVQFIGTDGDELFAPIEGGVLVDFADALRSCALVRQGMTYTVFDLAGRKAHLLGDFDTVLWADRDRVF
jgi:hypothetical protein